MNRILILKTGARFLFICILLALAIAIFGEDVIHPKYLLLVFFIASMFLTLNFLPSKNSANKIHDWAVFATCFVSFFLLGGVGFLFPVFFPKIGILYQEQIRTLNIVSVFVAVAAFLTSMVSIRSKEGLTRDEIIKNIIQSFDLICKKLNIKDAPIKDIGPRRCSLKINSDYKGHPIKLEAAYSGFGTSTIRRSKIFLRTDKMLEDFNIIVFKEQIEMRLENKSKENTILSFIKERHLDAINFRSTVIGKNEILVEYSGVIADVVLWQDFIDFAEMLVLNLEAK